MVKAFGVLVCIAAWWAGLIALAVWYDARAAVIAAGVSLTVAAAIAMLSGKEVKDDDGAR